MRRARGEWRQEVEPNSFIDQESPYMGLGIENCPGAFMESCASIDKLAECQPLTEVEVRKLCEHARDVRCTFSLASLS